MKKSILLFIIACLCIMLSACFGSSSDDGGKRCNNCGGDGWDSSNDCSCVWCGGDGKTSWNP